MSWVEELVSAWDAAKVWESASAWDAEKGWESVSAWGAAKVGELWEIKGNICEIIVDAKTALHEKTDKTRDIYRQ